MRVTMAESQAREVCTASGRTGALTRRVVTGR